MGAIFLVFFADFAHECQETDVGKENDASCSQRTAEPYSDRSNDFVPLDELVVKGNMSNSNDDDFSAEQNVFNTSIDVSLFSLLEVDDEIQKFNLDVYTV